MWMWAPTPIHVTGIGRKEYYLLEIPGATVISEDDHCCFCSLLPYRFPLGPSALRRSGGVLHRRGASGGFCGVRRVRAFQRRRPSPAICSRRLAIRRCRSASRLVFASASAKAFVESSCEYRCHAWVMVCSVLNISLRSFVKILSICIGFS
jgi:hypothetical protein